ncbi:hypothetical protein [Synechococcus sp. LTW-R]|uniref:hypothetical protein n=1 Tax=Synechococcus sp. LTW-R TaxID=2751170 RepID=UPI001626E5B5|nr:hypothetical protein [Synechococcus sp. LTW-R]QNG28585.1 hypothetical protein H0O22_07255 [Synechococcus sp. LTW-R]
MGRSNDELARLFPGTTLHTHWRGGGFIGIDANYVCMCMQCCAIHREAWVEFRQARA